MSISDHIQKRVNEKLLSVIMKITEKVIKGLEEIEIKLEKSRIIIDVLKKLYEESRLESIERKIKFSKLASN